MSAEIIRPNRYKKTTRKKIEKQKKDFKYGQVKKVNIKSKEIKNKNIKNSKTKKSIKLERTNTDPISVRLVKITFLVVALVLIGFISKRIVKLENFSLNVFSNKDENTNLVKNYYFNIALLNADTMDIYTTKNVVLNEIIKTTTPKLIDINLDYTIKYNAAENIQKIDDLNYLVKINSKSKVKPQEVIDSVNKIKGLSSKSPYYSNVKNIESITSADNNSLNIKLLEKDPYLPYKLSFPIYNQNDDSKKINNFEITDKASNSLTIVKNNSSSSLASVKVTNYTDTNSIINDFRDSKFDMFVVSTDSIMQQIGKHEYSIKKYKDGNTIFLLGNKNSALFSKKEVRQAIAYSINRDQIIKNINPSFSEVIDIPYIYSSVKYKYDIYGAQNILLSNGWKKSSSTYSKVIDGINRNLELNLLINKDDKIKVQIAQKISEMLKSNGITLNIISLDKNAITQRVNSGDYDLVLADVYINDIPDIAMLYSYININDNVNSKIEKINSVTTTDELQKAVDDLQVTISNEIACIGIMARNTNIVYQKNIIGFDNTMYMNLFKDFENIGKSNN